MPFPFSIRGKLELKSFMEGSVKPEMLRDAIASSLLGQKYPVHSQNLKITISSKILQKSIGEEILIGLAKGEINLYPKGTSLIVEYKFSMVHYMVGCTIFIALLFIINIKNPLTTTFAGLMSLGLLWCLLFCVSYILTAIMTAIKLPKFIKRCLRETREVVENIIQ